MTTELPKTFDPKDAQPRWLAFWDEHGFFRARADDPREAYTIVIPPPNVTGALHLGHALNNTLQDILIRWRRAQGYNVLWVPGTDHAGIATQAVVERRLRDTEGKTRHQIGRDELVKRIWAWKDQYEARILGQLKQLGASCDWSRTRFTLDPMCARAVRETFFKLFRDGLIYRGKRLVNWDTQLQTSVADDETYTETTKGGFWTFQYPVKDSATEFIRFSTTRPETMLGDTALCVHPSDERFEHLVGKLVTIPLVGRDIPVIADALLADMTLGTGCVKVTPAHDPNDYACGQRNKLPIINILHPDGTINENGGKYAGLDRFKAREAVVQDMEDLGLFLGREDREIPLKYSDRSKSPIEALLSDQWFVQMNRKVKGKDSLAWLALFAVDDSNVKFVPDRYRWTYRDWLSEERDWCVSRQLWWGHRIPVWRLSIPAPELKVSISDLLEIAQRTNVPKEKVEADQQELLQRTFAAKSKIFTGRFGEAVEARGVYDLDRQEIDLFACVKPDAPDIERQLESLGFEQDPDVLDTWFSSALWPHSTLGWPEQTADLAKYYPTNTLVTSRDIITLWVARMVMMGLYNVGDVPFRNVYIHPKILDGFGETMSKTKGNGLDPLDIIAHYGTDALRFSMAWIATETQDSRMPVANVCPHCGVLVPVKQEHMYMRTKKLSCPACKKEFRPGGPWLADDPDRPTARQASDKFDMGRNFANKLWNAARFLLMNLEGYTPDEVNMDELPLEDRWILSRLASTAGAITDQLEAFRFSEAARSIYEFTWSEFCDWYVEMSKGRLKDEATQSVAQRVFIAVLDGILRLVQPVMPFLAESLWQALGEVAPRRGLPAPVDAAKSVCIAPWPAYPESWRDPAMESRLSRMQELIRLVREMRNRYLSKDPRMALDIAVRCSEEVAEDFRLLGSFISQLAMVGKMACGPAVTKPKQAATQVHADFELYVSLAGLIDVPSEMARLEKQKAEKEKALTVAKGKLSSPRFVEGAKPEVVQQVRDQVADLENQLRIIEETLRDLREG